MVSGHHKELARGPFCEHICSEIFQDSTMLFTSQGNCGFQVIKLAGDNGATQSKQQSRFRATHLALHNLICHGHFDLKVFLNCRVHDPCTLQLTKTFRSKVISPLLSVSVQLQTCPTPAISAIVSEVILDLHVMVIIVLFLSTTYLFVLFHGLIDILKLTQVSLDSVELSRVTETS